MPGSSERDRHHEVMRLLEDAGRVSVPELAERFGVSVVTIRKDLERLERRRLLRRVRGGAVPAPSPDEGSFELRLHLHTAQKIAVAREAARMVRDGDAIAVDGSTTCYYLIKELRDRRGLVVVANGLPAAEALVESDATVVMPGGTLRRSSWALVGDMGATLAGRGRLTYGFFGLRALSPELGLLDLSPEETAVKRRLVSISSAVYGLFDSSKVGRFALHPFVESAGVTGLICDDGLPDEEVLARRRVETAAALLLHTDQPVTQIGRAVGWPDQNYFARRFKAHFGLSASSYRSRFAPGAHQLQAWPTTDPAPADVG